MDIIENKMKTLREKIDLYRTKVMNMKFTRCLNPLKLPFIMLILILYFMLYWLIKVIYYITKFIFIYFVIEAFFLFIIVSFNVILEVLYAFSLPTIQEQEGDPRLAQAASVFLWMLVIAAALGLFENLVNGIIDAWHTAEMPFFRNHIREMFYYMRKCKCAPEPADIDLDDIDPEKDISLQDGKKVLRREETRNAFDLVPVSTEKTIYEMKKEIVKEMKAHPTALIILLIKVLSVAAACWVAVTQKDGVTGVFGYFWQAGLYVGLAYFGIWLLINFLKMFFNFVMTRPLEDLEKLWRISCYIVPPKSQSGFFKVMQYVIFLLLTTVFFLLCIVLPMLAAASFKAPKDTLIALFWLLFFASIYVVLRIGMKPKTNRDKVVRVFYIFFLIGVLVVGLKFFTGFLESAYGTGCENVKQVTIGNSTINPIKRSYGICNMRWEGIDIVDYALFAHLSDTLAQNEETNLRLLCPRFEDQYNVYFPNTTAGNDWQKLYEAPTKDLVGFIHLYSPSRDLNVLAIRGTRFSKKTDLVQDIDLYVEVGLLQASSIIIPITFTWTDDFIASFVNFASTVRHIFQFQGRSYYDPVITYINNNINTGKLILTGHSLGGAVAKIVGARLNITAVTFAAPGVVWGSKKFEISVDAAAAYSVTIRPKNDLVSRIDKQPGLVQDIDCKYDDYYRCHKLISIICELRDSCGSSRNIDCTPLTLSL